MITTKAIFKIEKEINENLYLISVTLEKYKKWVPGMFMQVSLDNKSASEPWLDSRAFSFASWGSEKALILVRKEGTFTTRLISDAKKGFSGTVRYPFGNFLLLPDSSMVFVAGGAGISVFLSYLDYMNLEDHHTNELEIFHSAKSSEESIKRIYWNEIPLSIKLYQFITDKADINYTGRLTTDFLFSHTDNFSRKRFYICGPPQFNEYWIESLNDKGIIPYTEQWINQVNRQ